MLHTCILPLLLPPPPHLTHTVWQFSILFPLTLPSLKSGSSVSALPSYALTVLFHHFISLLSLPPSLPFLSFATLLSLSPLPPSSPSPSSVFHLPPSSGSPHVGPRFDATSTFIAHSVLAPSESYAAALYQDEEVGGEGKIAN